MTSETYDILKSVGFTGAIDTPSKVVISWLNEKEILRIEPYWRFLGANPGFSWSKSWEEFSGKIEVECDTWDQLLDIALEWAVGEALGR